MIALVSQYVVFLLHAIPSLDSGVNDNNNEEITSEVLIGPVISTASGTSGLLGDLQAFQGNFAEECASVVLVTERKS